MAQYSVRRSTVDDIGALVALAQDDAFILRKRFGEPLNLQRLIQSHFLAVTVLNADDRPVGFATFNDTPPTQTGIAAAEWVDFVKCGWLRDARLETLHACNTVWLTSLIVDPTDEFAIAHEIFTTAFATLANIDWLAMALPDDTPAFSPACDLLSALTEAGTCDSSVYQRCSFRGRIYAAHRGEIIPELELRVGAVEDYDDLIPLLNGGDGVVTPLPADLYLEELLQNQDERHAVIVAEDKRSGQVVGLMCLRATYDEQQHVVKQYATDHFGKLKPLLPQTTHKGQQTGHNVVHLAFFYLNPAYDNCAKQFVQRAFAAFPFAEYCILFLPHAAPVHPILHDFAYVPIKKLQPSNIQGDRLPLPEGLYLCCRYALEPVLVAPVTPAHEAAVTKMLASQSELSQDLSEATCVAFTQSVPVGSVSAEEMPFRSIVVTWRDTVVGVVVAKRCSLEEMYALRANYDLASFIDFDPDGDCNLAASDIAADPDAAPRTYHRDSMPGLLLKYAYLKPQFRSRLRFVLREALRFSGCEVLLYPATVETQVYHPLIAELVLAPPRNITEFPQRPATADGAGTPAALVEAEEEEAAADAANLLVLHITSRKLLSDEKTQINARIVVVGSGTTGLAFIYSLLQLPYLHFSNITLVSQDGLPDHPRHRKLLWGADTMEWSEREYAALKVGRKVRVIEGTMIDFDRQDRYIYSDNGTCEPYDHLVLTVGRQYAMPKELIKQGAKSGVFPLANAAATAKIKQHIHESEIYEDDRSRAVIYGSSLDAYAVAACVTQLELGAQRVVLVSPDGGAELAFQDAECAARVERLLDAIGIQCYPRYTLERLELDEDKNLSQVVIAPAATAGRGDRAVAGVVELDATMLVYAHDKDIDTQVLSALNKRSIVFDGRVIVENCYRTTDPFIYAAGPVAMFSRRFGPSEDFDVFNTLEVGRHLCHTILGFLGIDEFANADFAADAHSYVPKDDPLAAQLGTFREAPPEELARRRPKPIPTYKDHVCRRVTLPTGLVFFTCYSLEYMQAPDKSANAYTHLTSWSVETRPLTRFEEAHPPGGAAAAADGHPAAEVMMHGDDGVEKCYTSVKVAKDGRIAAVHFLGRDPRAIENLRALVGMPESTLNLCYNYAEAHATGSAFDLLAYLAAPWARAVFHDKYAALQQRIQALLDGHPDVAAVRREMLARVKATGAQSMAEADRKEALAALTQDRCAVRLLIEKEVLAFLHQHKGFLPQHYYLPDMDAHLRSPVTL